MTTITDADLLTAVARAAAQERGATANLIAMLAELDARRLYLGEGCSSLFTYCTQVLRLSEHAAYGRIGAARCARRFPIVLDLLTEGTINLTTIGLLAPCLTEDNVEDLLAAARHKSKREIERLVSSMRPLPPVPSTLRKLPTPAASRPKGDQSAQTERGRIECSDRLSADGGGGELFGDLPSGVCSSSPRPATVTSLAPERYKLQITMSRETHDKLRLAQDLLRHVIPNGDPAAIVDRALTLLVADLERTRRAATRRPLSPRPAASRARYVPAAVKREVWARDQGQCAFVGAKGRCTERGWLELHHLVPFSAGGSTTLENLALRCRRHNAYEAEVFFGPLVVRETQAYYSVQTEQNRPRNERAPALGYRRRRRTLQAREPDEALDSVRRHGVSPWPLAAHRLLLAVLKRRAAVCDVGGPRARGSHCPRVAPHGSIRVHRARTRKGHRPPLRHCHTPDRCDAPRARWRRPSATINSARIRASTSSRSAVRPYSARSQGSGCRAGRWRTRWRSRC